MTDPNAVAPEGIAPKITEEPFQVVVPAHLQDLREGDLPEGQRVAVLDQISLFRETAARKEREKKARELEQERRGEQHRPLTVADYGYGTRPFHHGGQAPQAGSAHGPGGNRQQQQQAHGPAANGKRDPQGYSEPVAFVKAQAAEAKVESTRTDEEEEELRLARRARERDQALREVSAIPIRSAQLCTNQLMFQRERMVEQRERHRIDAYNREMAIRHQQEELIANNKISQGERLAMWDDDELAHRGRELFLVDRARWRDQRHGMRTREYQDDVRDRQQEAEEQRQLEKESEAFLAQQMAELSEMERAEKEKTKGLLTEDAAPVRLALNVPTTTTEVAETAKKEAKKEEAKPKPKPKVMDFGGDDDEDDAGARRKRQTFVKLEADAGSSGAGMSTAEREAIRTAKLLELKAEIPAGSAVFRSTVFWSGIDDVSTVFRRTCDGRTRRCIKLMYRSLRRVSWCQSSMPNFDSCWARSTRTSPRSSWTTSEPENLRKHLWRSSKV